MKPIKPLFLSLLLLTACGTHTPPAAKSEVSLQKQEEQLFGAWDCELKAQRDIHSFAPKFIEFQQKDKLPAHLWAGYIEIEWKEENLNEAASLRYREWYNGFWRIKDDRHIVMTFESAGSERLFDVKDLKTTKGRETDRSYMKFSEQMAAKKSFKSTDYQILDINQTSMSITDGESLIACRKIERAENGM